MKRRGLRRRYGRTVAHPGYSYKKLSKATLVRHLANDLSAKNPGVSRRLVLAWIRDMTDLPMVAFGRGLITRQEYETLGGDPDDVYKGSK